MRRKRLEGNPMAQTNSLMYLVFSMAMKGTTITEIKKFCRKVGSRGSTRLIKILRSGEHYDRTWTIDERDGYIKVKDIQYTKKRSKKR
jgi:hypothetical protein